MKFDSGTVFVKFRWIKAKPSFEKQVHLISSLVSLSAFSFFDAIAFLLTTIAKLFAIMKLVLWGISYSCFLALKYNL